MLRTSFIIITLLTIGKLCLAQASDSKQPVKCLSDEEYRHVFREVEKAPEFKMGMWAWFKFVEDNINFAEFKTDLKSSKKDSVAVSFIVLKDGLLCDFSILNSSSDELAQAAISMLKIRHLGSLLIFPGDV